MVIVMIIDAGDKFHQLPSSTKTTRRLLLPSGQLYCGPPNQNVVGMWRTQWAIPMRFLEGLRGDGPH